VLDRIDHIGIACHDLAAKIAFYQEVFDLTVVSQEVNEEQGVAEAMLRVSAAPGGASWIQLLEPLGPDTPVGRFLARRGEGVHHIGYGVTDITAALAGRPAPAWLDGGGHRIPASGRRRRGAHRAGPGRWSHRDAGVSGCRRLPQDHPAREAGSGRNHLCRRSTLPGIGRERLVTAGPAG
jgi:methylmalonyl-CoA epimerase